MFRPRSVHFVSINPSTIKNPSVRSLDLQTMNASCIYNPCKVFLFRSSQRVENLFQVYTVILGLRDRYSLLIDLSSCSVWHFGRGVQTPIVLRFSGHPVVVNVEVCSRIKRLNLATRKQMTPRSRRKKANILSSQSSSWTPPGKPTSDHKRDP